MVSEQGKAPDFVLEVASRSTGRVDVGKKRVDYARLGIGGYTLDEKGSRIGRVLVGDRLVEGRYESIPIETVSGSWSSGSVSRERNHTARPAESGTTTQPLGCRMNSFD